MTTQETEPTQRPGDELAAILADFLHLYAEAETRFLALPLEDQVAIVDDAPTDMIEGLRASALRALSRMHPKVRADIVTALRSARQTALDAQAECDDRLSELREEVAMLRLEMKDHLTRCPASPRGAGPAPL